MVTNDDMKYITILPNGSKRISIRIGRGIDGKYLYDTKQFSKDVDIKVVKKERDRMLEEKKSKKNIDGSMLVETFAKKWLTEVVLNQSPNTYDDCYSKLKHHIIPYLGHKKLKDIDRDLVQELINYLATKETLNRKGKTLSPITVKHIINVLSSMLNYAIDLHMIKSSPCHDLKYPKINQYEKQVYNEQEMNTLVKELQKQSTKNKALFILSLTSGLRRGEIAGLYWEHIDIENKVINVKQAYYKTKIKGKVTTKPKSKYSIRKAPLSDLALECLLEYKEEQNRLKEKLKDTWNNAPNVFTDDIGNPLGPDAISNRWRRLVEKLPLKKIRLHDLRASFATYLVYTKTPLANISKTMGHSRISTTVDMYVKNYENYYETARDNINNIGSKT